MRYTDPDGEWVHLAIGALIGGIVNVATHWDQINGDFWTGAKYFGIGALAGGLSAGVGAGVSSLLAEGGFGAGFLGTAAARVVTSSFTSGFLIGGSSGVVNGFFSGTGNGLINGNSFSTSLVNGLDQARIQGTSGALLGGLAGGLNAIRDNRNFWTGKLPEEGNDRIWGEIRLRVDDHGEGSTRGHSWIETKSKDGTRHTYATWGNKDEAGNTVSSFAKDRKEFWVDFVDDKYRTSPFTHSYKMEITYSQKLRLDKFISSSSRTNWSFTNNCSGFAKRAFEYTTGVRIMSHPFFIPINTPAFLGEHLRFYGGF